MSEQEQREQQHRLSVETQLAEAATEVLAAAMAAKASSPTPVRVQALALVLGHKDGKDLIATVQILDVEQRVLSLRFAVKKLDADAFIFVYDGFITNERQQRLDALLAVTGTRWGTFTASATPYRHVGLGAAFDTPVEAPGAVEAYRGVFQ